jgi:hypothetical protein
MSAVGGKADFLACLFMSTRPSFQSRAIAAPTGWEQAKSRKFQAISDPH